MIPTAVVGVGQTHHKSRRRDVSFGGLVREAVFRALDDAEMTMSDIDAVVLGKAPDLFEGVMKPEQAEVDRARKEVAKLKMERDILKKAAAYFARESM